MIEHLNSKSINPKRVIVFGGNGFIGKKLVEILKKQNINILNIGSKDIDLIKKNSIEKVKNTICDSDTIVFLSAITPDRGRGIDALMQNLIMLRNLLIALKNKNIAHFIYFSSDAVYGNSENLITESSPCDPSDLYGTMHLTRELMLSEFKKLPLLILRLTMVYGQNDTHNSYGPNRFIHSVIKESSITLYGDGEERRDYIQIDDLVEIVNRCIFMKSLGVLNVATGNSKTFKEIAGIVILNFNKNVNIQYQNRSISVFHRHYNISNLYKSFPGVKLRKIENGIANYFEKK